jgi:hypothetical protein
MNKYIKGRVDRTLQILDLSFMIQTLRTQEHKLTTIHLVVKGTMDVSAKKVHTDLLLVTCNRDLEPIFCFLGPPIFLSEAPHVRFRSTRKAHSELHNTL